MYALEASSGLVAQLSWDDPWVQRALEIGQQVGIALGLLIGGWLLAKFLSWVVYRILLKTQFDDRVARRLGLDRLVEREKVDENAVERATARVVFFLLMLLVVVAVLQFAGLTQVAAPLQRFVDTVVQALPYVGKALLILGAAWLIGKGLGKLVTAALERTGVDDRFAELSGPTVHDALGGPEATAPAAEPVEPAEPAPADDTGRPFSETAGAVVFWLVMIVGLAGAFEALEITGVAEPLRNAIDTIVSYVPVVATAALILFGGWLLGRLAKTVIQNLLHSAGFDSLPEKVRLDKLFAKVPFSEVVGIAAMWFIIVQAVVAALERLGLTTLSEPLTNMLAQLWESLPAIAIAVAFVVLGVVLGRLLRSVVVSVLDNAGFDDLMARIGFGKLRDRADELPRPSELLGAVTYVAVILVAVAQALSKLDLTTWSGYVDSFLSYAVQHILVALVIVVVGFVLGNQLRDLILMRQKDEEDLGTRSVATFVRYAVLVFAFTMAVTQLEVAQEFVLLSFGLLFGGLCLGAAIALGLGGREVAGDVVRRQYERARRSLSGAQGSAEPDGSESGTEPSGGGSGG